MPGNRLTCRVLSSRRLTDETLEIRLEPTRRFTFEAGQFLSLVIGDARRLYSFASPPETVKRDGFVLCVKLVPGGLGSSYLLSLRPGDEVVTFAPYGDFRYRAPEPGRNVCLIATGSGIGAMRSILLSRRFTEAPPPETLLVAGARAQSEILYHNELSSLVPTVFALSGDAAPGFFPGRVTDYLRRVSLDWANIDFYICGNADMAKEAITVLHGYGVQASAIRKEVFHSTPSGTVSRPVSVTEASPMYAATLRALALQPRRG